MSSTKLKRSIIALAKLPCKRFICFGFHKIFTICESRWLVNARRTFFYNFRRCIGCKPCMPRFNRSTFQLYLQSKILKSSRNIHTSEKAPEGLLLFTDNSTHTSFRFYCCYVVQVYGTSAYGHTITRCFNSNWKHSSLKNENFKERVKLQNYYYFHKYDNYYKLQ